MAKEEKELRKAKEKENSEPKGKENDCQPPPKKLRVSSSKPRARKGKANKTPVRNESKKPSSILVVDAEMTKEPLKQVSININPSVQARNSPQYQSPPRKELPLSLSPNAGVVHTSPTKSDDGKCKLLSSLLEIVYTKNSDYCYLWLLCDTADEDASLLLSITVDDNSERLDKLEAIVARLEASGRSYK